MQKLKFLTNQKKNNFNLNYKNNFIINIYDNEHIFYILTNLGYMKKNVIKRKFLLNIKKGITKTEKKNSLKRDKNISILNSYLNIMIFNGNKNTLFKHFNEAVENFFYIFNNENDEFYKHKDYLILNYLSNNFIEYNDFVYMLNKFLPDYYSIFDIKTKKNNKKSKNKKKYSHKIFYIPENKRLKNTLKILNSYSNTFKNYNLWERLF